MLTVLDKARNFLLFSLLFSLFTYIVYYWGGGVWRTALYAVGFFSFYAAYFDGLRGRPRWTLLYFAAYLVAYMGVHFGFARAVVHVLMATMLFGPLLYGNGVGRLASLAFFWLGAVTSAVVVNGLGRLYRMAVPPAYDVLPTALPSPYDAPLYLLDYIVLWQIHCISHRWGGEIRCPKWR